MALMRSFCAQIQEDGSETKSLASMEGHTASVLCLETNGDR